TTRRQVLGIIIASGWMGANLGINRVAGRGPSKAVCSAKPEGACRTPLAADRQLVAGTPAEFGSGGLALPRFGDPRLRTPPLRRRVALAQGLGKSRPRRGWRADFAPDLARIAQPDFEVARRGRGELDARRLGLAPLGGPGDERVERVLRRL